MKINYDSLLPQRNCALCDKLIIINPRWVYKLRTEANRVVYYCSYTCYRKAGGDNGKFEYYIRGKHK